MVKFLLLYLIKIMDEFPTAQSLRQSLDKIYLDIFN
jgi:hypothetical protein